MHRAALEVTKLPGGKLGMIDLPACLASIAAKGEVELQHERPPILPKGTIITVTPNQSWKIDGGRVIATTTYKELIVGKVFKTKEVLEYFLSLMRGRRPGG